MMGRGGVAGGEGGLQEGRGVGKVGHGGILKLILNGRTTNLGEFHRYPSDTVSTTL